MDVLCRVMVDMRVRPATSACRHADLNAREEFLGMVSKMHVPRPT
jgi:hypothetical protein